MARSESPREDLLRQATAMPERAEMHVQGFAETVVVGFRRDGAGSVYLGQDRVYQFNTAGELRRAFVEPLLYKAEHGQLVSLRRERDFERTSLLRHELTAAESDDFLAAAAEHLRALADACASRTFVLVGQRSELHEPALLDRIQAWLMGLTLPPPIAKSAKVG